MIPEATAALGLLIVARYAVSGPALPMIAANMPLTVVFQFATA